MAEKDTGASFAIGFILGAAVGVAIGFLYAPKPGKETRALLKEKAEQYRHDMIEAIAEFDDGVMEKYLEGTDPSEVEIRSAIRKGTLAVGIVPVLCGAAFKNKGVQHLLDAIVDYLPSPIEVPDVEGHLPKHGTVITRRTADEEPFSALAFKIQSDSYVGKLTYFRVYSGVLKAGTHVLNPRENKKERVGRILQLHANKREELDTVYAGDIAAAVGLRFTKTGDTLCDSKHPIALESMDFPEPVIDVAIEPRTKADEDKLLDSLNALMEEDPTFRVTNNEETGQTIISGMGELHLEIITDRLIREFNVQANVGRPQVAFKETITKAVEAEGRFVRQSGGKGQYGHVIIRLEPGETGSGFFFENRITGGAIPKEFHAAVEKGVEESTSNGIVGGYPVMDIRVILIDGSAHDVDSTEIAFKIAGSMAFQEGLRKAEAVLLEPIMAVEVVVPEDYLGDVLGDLNGRRAQITGINPRTDAQVVDAQVPLREMFGYATDLRSKTQGRAVYTMQFFNYQIVTGNESRKMMEQLRGVA